MTIFNVFSLLGGLALFLFGMDIMGKALEKQAGGQLQKILSKLTDNPLKGFFLGLCVTAVIQSSSATTVMVVGFVNSGIMELHQAIGVIMGSNVGTTVTSWILSLSGLQGDSLLVQLLKPTSFSPVLAFIGFLLSLVSTEALGVPYLAPHPFPQQPLSEDGVLRRNYRQLSRQGFNIWQKRERGKRRS